MARINQPERTTLIDIGLDPEAAAAAQDVVRTEALEGVPPTKRRRVRRTARRVLGWENLGRVFR